jgi:putative heme transporter
MIETSFVKRRWRLLLNIFTICALILLAYIIRHQLADTQHNLTRVRAWVLLLIIPFEALNYHAQAKLYQGLFKVLDEKISYLNLLKLSLELNFVNHVFPSGGVSGISFFSFRLKGFNVSGSKATLVQTMKLMLYFIAFEPLLLLAMVILAMNGRVNDFTILIGSALTMLVFGGTGIFAYVIGSQTRINNFLTAMTKFINQLIHFFRPRHPETINIASAGVSFQEFHHNYILFRSRYQELKRPFWWAFLANVTEIAVIYVVYIAFGAYVDVGAIILAYAVANFAGLISVLPGGTGIYEALMTLVLVAAGIPARLSLPVTIMYRVLNTLLQLPPGYFLYHRTLRTSNEMGVENE